MSTAISTPAERPAAAEAGEEELSIRDSVLTNFLQVSAGFWASRERKRLVLLIAALTVIITATAGMQIRLNAWNQPFYDALTRKDLLAFRKQLGVFAELAAVLLLLNVAQAWLRETFRLALRESLVHALLAEWLQPLRALRLATASTLGENPDQRIHADALRLTELTTDLGLGLLQATLLLLSFVGVLWVLSRGMSLPIGGRQFHVPGYLVWCALLYAGMASLVSWLVGRPLAALDAQRYAREAELRSNLVRVNDEIEAVTVAGAEADEHDYLNRLFESVLQVSRRIVAAITRLTWVTAGYGWFTIVAPILVAGPTYLFGDMSFGELMVVVGAFNQVQSSLRWYVDNFPGLADWRATLVRVGSFRNALRSAEAAASPASRIELLESGEGSIQFDDLTINAPAGPVRLSEPQVSLQPGERILIVSELAEGRSSLFQALIGIWPWGRGRIRRPARQAVMFLSGQAHVPPGPLRAALADPRSLTAHDDTTIAKALADVGLEHLVPSLDAAERWDRRLSDDEKRRLNFARAILQRPQWLVLNGVLEPLDVVSRERILALLPGTLSGVGVLNIGPESASHAIFTRRLHLLPARQAERPESVEPCASSMQPPQPA